MADAAALDELYEATRVRPDRIRGLVGFPPPDRRDPGYSAEAVDRYIDGLADDCQGLWDQFRSIVATIEPVSSSNASSSDIADAIIQATKAAQYIVESARADGFRLRAQASEALEEARRGAQEIRDAAAAEAEALRRERLGALEADVAATQRTLADIQVALDERIVAVREFSRMLDAAVSAAADWPAEIGTGDAGVPMQSQVDGLDRSDAPAGTPGCEPPQWVGIGAAGGSTT